MTKPSNNKVVPIYNRPSIEPKNEKQKRYINAIRNRDIVIAIGPAGTGKTFLPAVLATDMLHDSRSPIETIVIVRPPEGPGKSHGFVPGDLNDKLKVWSSPILAGIKHRLGGGLKAEETIDYYIKIGKIKLLSLEHIRGESLNNSFIILDEAENTSWHETKAVMTRIGLDSKLIICGDIAQKDIRGGSGLDTLLRLTNEYEYLPWSNIEFTLEDCVRSPLVKNLLYLFEAASV